MISKTKNKTSNAIMMFHLYFRYYFPFYSVCDKSCSMIVFFVVTKNLSFTLPPKRNSFLHSLLLLSFTFSFPSFCDSRYRTHFFFLFSHLTFFRVLYFIHRMYIAFTFTRKQFQTGQWTMIRLKCHTYCTTTNHVLTTCLMF